MPNFDTNLEVSDPFERDDFDGLDLKVTVTISAVSGSKAIIADNSGDFLPKDSNEESPVNVTVDAKLEKYVHATFTWHEIDTLEAKASVILKKDSNNQIQITPSTPSGDLSLDSGDFEGPTGHDWTCFLGIRLTFAEAVEHKAAVHVATNFGIIDAVAYDVDNWTNNGIYSNLEEIVSEEEPTIKEGYWPTNIYDSQTVTNSVMALTDGAATFEASPPN